MKEKDMIPKTIHYVWVGGKEKPKDIKRCMKTWPKKLDGYVFKEWNEKNFDINKHPFCKAAYDAKKWAFVSDYIRMYVIYNEGGIYLDTDVLVLKNFDDLLKYDLFVGHENPNYPFTAVFGAKKHNKFIKKVLDYYDSLKDYSFNFKDNNTISVSNMLVDYFSLRLGNQRQYLKENTLLLEDYYLCNPSLNSYTVHIFTGTWLYNKNSMKYKFVKFLKLRLSSKYKTQMYDKLFVKKFKHIALLKSNDLIGKLDSYILSKYLEKCNYKVTAINDLGNTNNYDAIITRDKVKEKNIYHINEFCLPLLDVNEYHKIEGKRVIMGDYIFSSKGIEKDTKKIMKDKNIEKVVYLEDVNDISELLSLIHYSKIIIANTTFIYLLSLIYKKDVILIDIKEKDIEDFKKKAFDNISDILEHIIK